jgi:hypothetical protein
MVSMSEVHWVVWHDTTPRGTPRGVLAEKGA